MSETSFDLLRSSSAIVSNLFGNVQKMFECVRLALETVLKIFRNIGKEVAKLRKIVKKVVVSMLI